MLLRHTSVARLSLCCVRCVPYLSVSCTTCVSKYVALLCLLHYVCGFSMFVALRVAFLFLLQCVWHFFVCCATCLCLSRSSYCGRFVFNIHITLDNE